MCMYYETNFSVCVIYGFTWRKPQRKLFSIFRVLYVYLPQKISGVHVYVFFRYFQNNRNVKMKILWHRYNLICITSTKIVSKLMQIVNTILNLETVCKPILNILQHTNKRPLGLTAPLSNNTLCMIHTPMNKFKCHGVNWKTIWFTIYVFHAQFDKMFHLWDEPLTLIWPWKVIKGQMSWGKLIVHRWLPICVSNKLWPERA